MECHRYDHGRDEPLQTIGVETLVEHEPRVPDDGCEETAVPTQAGASGNPLAPEDLGRAVDEEHDQRGEEEPLAHREITQSSTQVGACLFRAVVASDHTR